MSHTTAVDCLGVTLRFESSSADALALARTAVPFRTAAAKNAAGPTRHYLIDVHPQGSYAVQIDGTDGFAAPNAAWLRHHLRLDVRRFVARHAPSVLFVHAGVVARGGRGLVLPGLSRSGKSTLVAALVRAGATLYGEDYALLDAKGRLLPSSDAVSLRGEGGRRDIAVEALGGRVGDAPVRVGAVALLAYEPGASLTLRPLSPGRLVHETLMHTPSARDGFSRAVERLREAFRGAAAVVGTRGEADAVARRLLDATLG